jgi:cell division protein FtsB
MARFGKQKTVKEYLYSKPVMVILAIVMFLLLISVYERYQVAHQMTQRREHTQAQKEELLERKMVLEEKVEYLAGDRGLEEEIRTHFDVAKEGEKVIILMGDGQEKSEQTPPEPKKPWYQFW